jgi:O-antigen biosynthesis protein WbqV
MIIKSEEQKQERMRLLVIAHDLAMAIFAYWFAAAIIMPLHKFAADINIVLPFAFGAGVGSILFSAIYSVFARSWRLASLLDFVALIKSAVTLTIVLSVIRQIAHIFYPEPFFIAEMRVLFLGCILLVGFQASGRIFYRYYRFWRGSQKEVPRKTDATLVIGHISEIEGALRSVEQGAVSANIVGALLMRGDAFVRNIRGCKIFGFSEDLESTCDLIAAGGQNVTSVLLMSGLISRHDEIHIVKRIARRLGISLLKIEAVNLSGSSEMRLEEFLFRERRQIDHRPIDAFVAGKTFLITGGGGTIGGDIALRAISHGAHKVWLLDQSELGLQTSRAQISKEFPNSLVEPILCNIRDLDRMKLLFSNIKPDVVIHAAALKHVDLTEENWQEAVNTNVFGTANVLEAVDQAHVPVLINISTDKAADPVGMLGLTKHFAELLVAAFAAVSLGRRFSVRFGNVLGSSGSVIETFVAKISAGGPVTITHP